MRRSPTLLLALVAMSPLVLAACGDTDDTTSTDMPMSDSDGMDHGGPTGHDEPSPVADGARRIGVTATSFEFDPDEIRVEVGEDVAIVLSSDDILHDLTIDELDAHVAADAGETSEGGFRADEPGRYTYYCTVDGHRAAGMEGTLIVEAP